MNMGTKKQIIKAITDIIKITGALSNGQCETDSDIYYGSIGNNVTALIETYGDVAVSVSVYVRDVYVHEFEVYYDDLTVKQLKEILSNVKRFYKNENS